MTRDEIVTALRKHADQSVGNEWGSSIIGLYDNLSDAADLIENQQRHIEALMQANAALRDTVLRRDEQIEKLAADRKALINELCQYCGKYKQAHEGACDGCKWRGI